MLFAVQVVGLFWTLVLLVGFFFACLDSVADELALDSLIAWGISTALLFFFVWQLELVVR